MISMKLKWQQMTSTFSELYQTDDIISNQNRSTSGRVRLIGILISFALGDCAYHLSSESDQHLLSLPPRT